VRLKVGREAVHVSGGIVELEEFTVLRRAAAYMERDGVV